MELDSGSWFSDYKGARDPSSLTKSLTEAKFKLEEILYTFESHNKRDGTRNGFKNKDEMLSNLPNIGIRNFIMPQRDLFGYCDNFKSTTFMKNINPDTDGTCVQ